MTTRTIEEADRLSVFCFVESQGAVLVLRDKNGNAFAAAHMGGESLDDLIEILNTIQRAPGWACG